MAYAARRATQQLDFTRAIRDTPAERMLVRARASHKRAEEARAAAWRDPGATHEEVRLREDGVRRAFAELCAAEGEVQRQRRSRRAA